MPKSKILKKNALEIAKKLGAVIESDGKHQKATFYYDGKLILTFGIRHGRDTGHGHLVGTNKPLGLSETALLAFSRCTPPLEKYVEMLIERGKIEAQKGTEKNA